VAFNNIEPGVQIILLAAQATKAYRAPLRIPPSENAPPFPQFRRRTPETADRKVRRFFMAKRRPLGRRADPCDSLRTLPLKRPAIAERHPRMPFDPELAAPSPRLLLMESRAAGERLAFVIRYRRLLRDLPRGNGQAVMVVPGFSTSDATIAPLLKLLHELGFAAYGWGQGRNLGMRRGIKDGLARQLAELENRHGPVTLVGWSLGGVFVREMARHQARAVRRIITLGSPINGHPDAHNMVLMFRLANHGKKQKTDIDGFRRRMTPPPVPCTAVYTRTDGIVAWQACLEDAAPNVENLEVRGSHFGLPFNPAVARIIADRVSRTDRS
jgi:esterase/lipase